MISPQPMHGVIQIAGTVALAVGLSALAIAPAQGAGGAPAVGSTQQVSPRAVPSSSALAVIRTIPLGASGLAAAVGGQSTVTASDDTIYLTSNDATLAVIDPVSLAQVATLNVGNTPIGVTVHPDDTVYVVNAGDNTLTAINGRTYTGPQTIGVPLEPQVVAVSRVSDDTLFISSRSTFSLSPGPLITTLSARTLSGAVSTSLGSSYPTPFGMALTSDDSAYIATWPDEPRLFNATTRVVTILTSLGTGYHGVAVSAEDTVYMTNESTNELKSFAAATPGTVLSVPVPFTPQSVTIGGDGTVYVASRGEAKVSAINPATNQVDDSVTVGSGPYGIAATRTGLVITANSFESAASIAASVSPSLMTPIGSAGDVGSLTVGGLPAGVLVDDTTVTSISFGDDTVSWTRTPGTNTFTGPIPSGAGTLDVIVSLNGGNRAYAGSFTYSVPPTPLAPTPADSPRAVTASAGNASASVSWKSPESSGSFSVSHYLATSAPGGRTCLVTAPALTCDVAGLSNGTAYTFTVSALTGAGWSSPSAPSNVVVPRSSAKPSIVITGSRDGSRISVSGSSDALGMGGMVTPWTSKGPSAYAPGREVLVSVDGTFTWSREASRRSTWRVYFTAEDLRSNAVTFPRGSQADTT